MLDTTEPKEPLALDEAPRSRFVGIDLHEPTRQWHLGELLEIFEDIDEGRLIVEQKTIDHLHDCLSHKVDACRFKTDEWRGEAERFRGYVQEFEQAARALEAKADRLESRIEYNMRRRGWLNLRGEKFEISLTKSERVSLDLVADAMRYMKHSNFMRRSYAWDIPSIKKALKAAPESLSELAESVKIEQKYHVKFSPKKDSK